MLIVSSRKVQEAMLAREVGTMTLTKLSGLPSKTVSNFVTADRRARIQTIIKLARALDVSPLELVREAS